MDGDRTIVRGEGPLVATALHAGHAVWPDRAARLALAEPDRLREEDPYTDAWTACAATRVNVALSRFVVDLNRPREGCVYSSPDEAWGLTVYDPPLDSAMVDRALASHDTFYAEIDELLTAKVEEHGWAIVLDLHSYNHRRRGPKAPHDDPASNPDLNVGTGTLPVRWTPVARACSEALVMTTGGEPRLDVRENVRFRGGHFPAWAHARFSGDVCVLALEAKKTFMDEWTGELDPERHAALGRAFERVAEAVLATAREVTA